MLQPSPESPLTMLILICVYAQAFSQMETNPNSYYYRFLPPGVKQRNGKWSDEEHRLFMERYRELGANGEWGIFSMKLPGRVGYQCSNYYRSLILKKIIRVEDTHYEIEDGKLHHTTGRGRAATSSSSSRKKDGANATQDSSSSSSASSRPVVPAFSVLRRTVDDVPEAASPSPPPASSSSSSSSATSSTISSATSSSASKRRASKAGRQKSREDMEMDPEVMGRTSVPNQFLRPLTWLTTSRTRGAAPSSSSSSSSSSPSQSESPPAEEHQTAIEKPAHTSSSSSSRKHRSSDKQSGASSSSSSKWFLDLIDPITLDPMVNPAISPDGFIMNWTSWVGSLEGKNLCPFTQKPLTLQQLVRLTPENASEYQEEIQHHKQQQ